MSSWVSRKDYFSSFLSLSLVSLLGLSGEASIFCSDHTISKLLEKTSGNLISKKAGMGRTKHQKYLSFFLSFFSSLSLSLSLSLTHTRDRKRDQRGRKKEKLHVKGQKGGVLFLLNCFVLNDMMKHEPVVQLTWTQAIRTSQR